MNKMLMPFLMQPPDESDHVLGLGVAHAGRRLVEQQKPRFEAERNRHFDDALIAVRELAHDARIGLRRESGDLEQLVDASAPRARSRARPMVWGSGRGLDPDANIIVNGEIRQDFGDLECPHDALGDAFNDGRPGNVLTRRTMTWPLVGRQEAADQIEKCRLAGAVRDRSRRAARPRASRRRHRRTAFSVPKCRDIVHPQ